MKRTLALLLTCFMLLTIAACGGGSGPADPASTKADAADVADAKDAEGTKEVVEEKPERGKISRTGP